MEGRCDRVDGKRKRDWCLRIWLYDSRDLDLPRTVCFDYLSAPLPIRPCEIISVQKQLYGSNQSRVTDRGVWDLSIIGKTGHFELCSMAESLSPWSGRFLPNLCIKDYRLRQSPRLRTILLFLPRFRFQIFKPIYFSK